VIYQQDVVIGVRLTTSILTLIGSLFIIVSMLVFQRLKHMSARLIFSLTLSALLDSCANLLSFSIYEHEFEQQGECLAQAIIMQFSQISSFAWVTVIAINLYIVTTRSWDTSKQEKFLHIGVWLFALICTAVPFANPGSYGPSGLWCWITKGSGQVYRWAVFYIPLILMTLIVCVVYILIIRMLLSRTKEASEGAKNKVNKLASRLLAYPIIFVLCWIWALINRVYDATATYDSFFLYFMHSLSTPSFGLLNAVAYGYDPELRKLWLDCFYRHGCCKDDEENPEVVSSSSEDITFHDLEVSPEKSQDNFTED